MSKPRRISELQIEVNPKLSDLIALASDGVSKRITLGSTLNGNLPATFGSTTINGDLDVNGNLRVSQLVSASILYESGSTLFGNSNDDTHTFTGSLYITGGINDVSEIQFDITHNETPTIGHLCWNADDNTLNLGITDEVVLQMGQEVHYPKVVNKDSVNIVNGTLLMIRPTDITQGTRLAVVRWDGTQGYPSDYIVGIATSDIAINQEGFATWFGYVRDISITELESNGLKDPLETWGEGQILYPHPTLLGGLTNVRPNSPNVKSTIAATISLTGINLTILVRPKLGQRFEELYNVDFASAVTGSIVYKSDVDSQWGTTAESIKVIPPHLILTEVSESLNFANDGLAAAGGVPLGGLYRNGNVIQIRIV
jgi:hypothetical protein